MHISEIDTPAIVIDLDIVESNIRKMAGYTAQHGLALRPHTKTHKSPIFSRMQLAAGASGLTAAKVSEAEIIAQSGVEDLLIAYPLYGPEKARRAAALARQTRLTVSVDSLEVAQPLSEAAQAAGSTIGLLAEVDVGLHRVGVQPELFVPLLKQLSNLPATELRGMAFYPGHIKGPDEKALADLAQLVSILVSDARAAGFELPIVSGGSTPTLWQSHRIAGLTEIRPGTFIFNDRNTIISGACAPQDCAATVLATVVSTSVPGQYVIDGGSKTFSSDRAAADGFGVVLDAPQALFEKMNEEHGYVKHAGHARKVGDKIRVLPNHICVAMNLHEQVYAVRGETVEQVIPVAARARLQ
jgi:D-serine deaminase-like pyridoxal phosphate-dependent protein